MHEIKRTIQRFCQMSQTYNCEELGYQTNGAYLFVMAMHVHIYGKSETFTVNINIFEQNYKSAQFIVPLYEAGVVGRDVGSFYQALGELSAGIDGNAKIVPYPYDQSNQPVIMLTEALNRLDERVLGYRLDSLFDIYISVRVELDRLIHRLGLRFDPRARLESPHYRLIDQMHESLGDE
jgi:hypothetical protein